MSKAKAISRHSTSVPGLSSRSAARIREMGTDRIRITRPGGFKSSQKPTVRKRKTA